MSPDRLTSLVILTFLSYVHPHRVAEDNTISACPSKGFGAGVIIGCVVGRTVTLQDATTHKKQDSLWPVSIWTSI